ncbi:DNA repair protein RecN [Propionibacterium sp.]|uniref:DNA repair protein RecN n=1 Tax=Propionibacterium sp. TaxID=1977903 RepID=UPI0039EC593B
MLSALRIAGLGVIEASELEPAQGLTAITGETGAGKTMIVTGLGLLLGSRADAHMVRVGSRRAQVEGDFTGFEALVSRLAEAGADTADGELIVTRQVQDSGRSRAWVGGVQTPIGATGEIVAEMATIHGQSEVSRLANPERQRELLDRYAGPEFEALLEAYREVFAERRQVAAELDERVSNARERAQERDLLRFGLDEIGAVGPKPGEDAELAAQASRLQALDDLRMLAEQAGHALSGADDGDPDDPGALGLVGSARKSVHRIADLDSRAAELVGRLDVLSSELGEMAAEIASYLADLEADPNALEAVTSRRAALAGLFRKYGATADEVISWAADAARRVGDLDTDGGRIEELQEKLGVLDAELAQQAGHLHTLRDKATHGIAGEVQGELADLAMPHAKLEFQLGELSAPGPWGTDRVQLLFSANPGSPLAPLAKMASGGELSRVRLALEAVLAGSEPGHTFVFDEVDAGVGGRVALQIGRRLARLAQHSQVIVVTHLAQVAVFADRHYVVTKANEGSVTASDIVLAEGDRRLHEIARLMAGTESDTALAHAKELMEQTQAMGT